MKTAGRDLPRVFNSALTSLPYNGEETRSVSALRDGTDMLNLNKTDQINDHLAKAPDLDTKLLTSLLIPSGRGRRIPLILCLFFLHVSQLLLHFSYLLLLTWTSYHN
jgi:hypothetical protein